MPQHMPDYGKSPRAVGQLWFDNTKKTRRTPPLDNTKWQWIMNTRKRTLNVAPGHSHSFIMWWRFPLLMTLLYFGCLASVLFLYEFSETVRFSILTNIRHEFMHFSSKRERCGPRESPMSLIFVKCFGGSKGKIPTARRISKTLGVRASKG